MQVDRTETGTFIDEHGIWFLIRRDHADRLDLLRSPYGGYCFSAFSI